MNKPITLQELQQHKITSVKEGKELKEYADQIRKDLLNYSIANDLSNTEYQENSDLRYEWKKVSEAIGSQLTKIVKESKKA